MGNDTCRQCTRRRIKCDGVSPRCGKCIKKGIECSGIGNQPRFVNAVASRGKLKGCTVPVIKPVIPTPGPSNSKVRDSNSGTADPPSSQPTKAVSATGLSLTWMNTTTTTPAAPQANHETGSNATANATDEAIPLTWVDLESPVATSQTAQDAIFIPADEDVLSTWMDVTTDLVVAPTIPEGESDEIDEEILSPWIDFASTAISPQAEPYPSLYSNPIVLNSGMRFLFDHFANSIASYMVVIDNETNGYRDLVLPMACYDPLVQRAVSVVSAFHLSHWNPELRKVAEVGRSAILTKLRENAMDGQAENVFTPSTWATVVVLLIGETITGSMDFIYLFKMLMFLVENHGSQQRDSLSTFLLHQSKMFKLFTPPLLGMFQASETADAPPDAFFEWLSHTPIVDTLHSRTISIIKEAIRRIYTLSILRTSGRLSDNQSFLILDGIKLLVLPIEKHVPGAHALVWVYFMAAAESGTLEHREFFRQRLCELYTVGNFGNIPVALQTLECIWSSGSQRGKTGGSLSIPPVLIM